MPTDNKDAKPPVAPAPSDLLSGGNVEFSTPFLGGTLSGKNEITDTTGRASLNQLFGNGNQLGLGANYTFSPDFRVDAYDFNARFGVGPNGTGTFDFNRTIGTDTNDYRFGLAYPNDTRFGANLRTESGLTTEAGLSAQGPIGGNYFGTGSVVNRPQENNSTTVDLTATNTVTNDKYTGNFAFDNSGVNNIGVTGTVNQPGGVINFGANAQPTANTGNLDLGYVGERGQAAGGINFTPDNTRYFGAGNITTDIPGGTREIRGDGEINVPQNGQTTVQGNVSVRDTLGANTREAALNLAPNGTVSASGAIHSEYASRVEGANPAVLDANLRANTLGDFNAGASFQDFRGNQFSGSVDRTGETVVGNGRVFINGDTFTAEGRATFGNQQGPDLNASIQSKPLAEPLAPGQSGIVSYGANVGVNDAQGVYGSAELQSQLGLGANTTLNNTISANYAQQQFTVNTDTRVTYAPNENTEISAYARTSNFNLTEAGGNIRSGNFTGSAAYMAQDGSYELRAGYEVGGSSPAKPFDEAAAARQINGAVGDFRDQQAIAFLNPADKALYNQALAGVQRLNAEQGANLPERETASYLAGLANEKGMPRIDSVELGKQTANGQNLIIADGKGPGAQKEAVNRDVAASTPVADSVQKLNSVPNTEAPQLSVNTAQPEVTPRRQS
jgi:hypothetical protein